MSRQTFAGKVREALAARAPDGEAFSCDEVYDWVGIQTYAGKQTVLTVLRDMLRRKEVERIDRGKYRYLGVNRKPSKQYFMWRRLRKGAVSLKDLMIFAGVSRNYAQEWLRTLIRLGVAVEREDGTYQLIKDAVEMPRNDAKAERLQQLRARRKANLIAIIDDAQMRLQEAAQRLDEARGEIVASD